MTVQDNLKILSNKLILMDSDNKKLYFKKDWNGFSGKKGIFYDGAFPFLSTLIGHIMVETPSAHDLLGINYDQTNPPKYFPDPGIGIFDLNNKLIDTIYWNENPHKILEYFTNI
jgi:hypothetical protein